MFFALSGMNVVGYDNNTSHLKVVSSMVQAYDLPIELREEDLELSYFGHDQYDTFIARATFNHFPSQERALAVLDRAIDALKPGGRFWLRVGGKHGTDFEELENYSYFDPVELMAHVATKTQRIEHSQILPANGEMNIMFGENWREDAHFPPDYEGAMVTILAEK
jgi:SAM-dependent methyltransferase